MIIAPTVPTRSLITASSGGERTALAQRLTLPVDIDSSPTTLYDEILTDQERATLATAPRQGYHAAAAVIPSAATPELLSPLPTGAERAKAIVPSSGAAASPVAPVLALPPPTSDDAAAVTALAPEHSVPTRWLAPSTTAPPSDFAPPQGGDPYAPPAVAPQGAPQGVMAPSAPGWPSPTPLEPQLAPVARSVPWVPIGLGLGMAVAGIYLLTKKRGRRGRD